MQTFLLLAYFNIALLSITIANYAVSASYLGRESVLSRWRMERRKNSLLEELKKLRETAQIESIKTEIKKADSEQERLSARIFRLSWLGAVILPSTFFIISFIFAVVGMNSEMLSQHLSIIGFLEQIFIVLSSSTIAFGFMILLVVIRTIDSAAKQLPRPKFDVYFENRDQLVKLRRNERTGIEFFVHNIGEDIAENVEVYVMFPPTFKVHSGQYVVVKQTADSDHPNYDAAIFSANLIHIDIVLSQSISVTPPEQKKTYEIPISIYERKTGSSVHKLTIEVVD